MRRMLALFTVFVLTVAGVAVVPDAAGATVPGAVGRIVFVSDRDHSYGEIYTRSFSGGAWTRLTSDSATDTTPAWSPDGSQIAYTSDAAGSRDIWVMNTDGSGKQNLTSDAFWSEDPDWSPDGGWIVYNRQKSSSPDWDVWAMRADGSGKTNLTSQGPGTTALDPAWSPDGSKIAFVSYRGGSADVYVMDPDGSNATRLTNDASSWPYEPCWSPDGKQIAFMWKRGGIYPDLYVMNADGSNQRRLTNSPSVSKADPAWSPDGRHILFTSWDGDEDLWMVDPDGSNPGHLTDHPNDEEYGGWESVNRPPVAVDDVASVPRGGAVKIEVLANDSDPDGDRLMLESIVASPKHGAITNKWVTTFVYEHDGSASTSDSFTYRAKDTRSGVSNVATVMIKIGVPDTVGLVDPGSGVWRLRNTAGVVSEFFYGDPGDYPFVGDWDCDGEDTPGLYRQSDGYAYLRNSNTQGIADLTFFFGNPGDVPIAGDFNNNGCDTLSIYRPSEARFYIINQLGQDGGGLGAADYSFLFGDAGDKPVVGDWDGDGIDEVGLHRELTGFFYYRNTLSTGIADGQFYFGDPGDRFVAGDWGIVDGADTPGLFRPSNQVFYFRHDLTQGNADSQFTWTGAGSSWLPVAGDFNLN